MQTLIPKADLKGCSERQKMLISAGVLQQNPWILQPGNQERKQVPQNGRDALLTKIMLEQFYIIQRANTEKWKKKKNSYFILQDKYSTLEIT